VCRLNTQFLIVVDDLNRVDTPNKLLHKLSTWAKPRPSDSSKPEPLPSPFLIVCPVWPRVLESMNLYLDKTPWVHTVFVGAMTSTEAQTAIQASAKAMGRTITDAEAAVITEKLGKDAILIGLYSKLMTNTEHVVPEDVIEKFVAGSINEAAVAQDGRHLDSEYWEALSSLTLNMLQKRNLHPLWSEIVDWLGSVPDGLDALRDLIRQGELCRLTQISGEERLTFRHDRIQENLLVRSTIRLLEDPARYSEVLAEPFYAEVIGQALLRSPQDSKFLRRMREKLPLALVVALQCFGEPTCSYHEEIIEEIKEWAKSTVKTRSVPDSILNAVCWKLLETDSPLVLEITEAFPRYWSILFARLRNGCARSGVLYCAKGDSQFMINNPLRDRIIEHAKQRHGKQLLRQLRQFFNLCS
jgi:predicted small metal-binding protein